MGALRKKMPVTFWTFLVGTLALCGVPPFSGFYSKDAILARALHVHNYPLFAIALLTWKGGSWQKTTLPVAASTPSP